MSENVVVMGDLNIDIICSQLLPNYMKQTYNLKQIVQEITTDYGSCLDHIYTNINCTTLTELVQWSAASQITSPSS